MLNAENSNASTSRLKGYVGLPVEGGYGVFFLIVQWEELRQVGELKHVRNFAGDLGKLNVATLAPSASQQPDHGAQSTAVHKGDIPEVKDKV